MEESCTIEYSKWNSEEENEKYAITNINFAQFLEILIPALSIVKQRMVTHFIQAFKDGHLSTGNMIKCILQNTDRKTFNFAKRMYHRQFIGCQQNDDECTSALRHPSRDVRRETRKAIIASSSYDHQNDIVTVEGR
eukprot:CAMPEP_0196579126 /NCGR_PEP_ID=MMETSP1081-20130531/17665_1 /TAXON_ID=36882 /ORGANISM="Pyramimonas amylifera, Strain CCMP720" /LENGTH=135 /DNA_ID=CAMNT_0041898595 /DNA_START=158 /DNA_END=565 /DNA_ORIENTATION=+